MARVFGLAPDSPLSYLSDTWRGQGHGAAAGGIWGSGVRRYRQTYGDAGCRHDAVPARLCPW